MCQKCQLYVLPCHHYMVIYQCWEIVLGLPSTCIYFLIELSWLKSVPDFPVAPCFLPIALLMSGRFLGVSLMDTHHFNVFQWNLFNELRGMLAQSCTIE